MEKSIPSKKSGNSAMVKLMAIGALVLLLLIPMQMIEGIIMERGSLREEVVAEVSTKWGNKQTIGGPILSIPFKQYHTDKKNNVITTIHTANFLPEQLRINGVVNTEKRYRGIYEVVLYKSDLLVNAVFHAPAFTELGIEPKDILWEKAVISMGLSDLRGIKENNMVIWNDKKIPLNSGIGADAVMCSGISARVPVDESRNSYTFEMNLNLNGSGQLHFLPLGKNTTVTLSSSWTCPSFSGAFLPDERTINDNGFKAVWKILNLNRNYPQQWVDGNKDIIGSAFGVGLIAPVEEYQKATRSAKYSVLFILLTFMAFFITEVLKAHKVHPIQYLMVGFAVCLFYVLLVSISEHSNFGIAYLISSIATVTLVAAYSKGILKSLPLAATVGGLLTFLYGFLYITLQMEDYALLMGSIGLFIALGVVMYVTRRIDWYSMGTAQTKVFSPEIQGV